MVDIHTHLLPFIDDGASSVEEAIEMINSLKHQNIRKIVCTPHFDPLREPLTDFIEHRKYSMNLIRNINPAISLVTGSETILHSYLFHYSDISELCIGDTRYILLELPYLEKWENDIYEMLEKIMNYFTVFPVIAHIERYPAVKRKVYHIQKLVDLGCIIQLNTASVLNHKTKKKAINYIKKGYIDVLASDCHNMKERSPVMDDAFAIIKEFLGKEKVNELIQNSEWIVEGIIFRKRKDCLMI